MRKMLKSRKPRLDFHFYWSGAYTQQINLKNDKIVYNVNRG